MHNKYAQSVTQQHQNREDILYYIYHFYDMHTKYYEAKKVDSQRQRHPKKAKLN